MTLRRHREECTHDVAIHPYRLLRGKAPRNDRNGLDIGAWGLISH